jgi:membrane-associated phospholipid phosphatase
VTDARLLPPDAAAAPTPPVAVVQRRRRPSGEPAPLPRKLQRSGRFWFAAAIVVIALWVVATSTSLGDGIQQAELDLLPRIESWRRPVLTDVMLALHALGSIWTIRLLAWSALLVMVVARRWRHVATFLLASGVLEIAVTWMAHAGRRPRPIGVEILGGWQGYSLPSRPLAMLALALVVLAYGVATRGRWRFMVQLGGTALLLVLAAARIYLGVDHPSDVVVGAVLGVAVPVLAFRLVCPDVIFPVTYRRGRTAHLQIDERRATAIRTALQDQLGIVVREITPFALAGSAGSTPLRITVDSPGGTSTVFGKLYAANHLRADRWYKLGRALLYGRLEDEAPFENVRRLVQHEDYVLRVMRDADVPVPEPHGFVEITPEREYLLVTGFLDDASESGDVDMSSELIDDGLRLVRRLWDAGLAHRDIKPANVMVQGDRVVLIDAAFSQVRPSPWRQAVDLANMMMVLALHSEPALVYQRALLLFSPHEIAEAFAATSQATRPSLRKLFRTGEHDLLQEFRALAPPHPRIRVQRWSTRRVLLTARVLAITVVLVALVAGQLRASGLL